MYILWYVFYYTTPLDMSPCLLVQSVHRGSSPSLHHFICHYFYLHV